MSQRIAMLLGMVAVAAIPLLVAAQTGPQAGLRAAFEAAWARQPESAGLEARRAAAQARRRTAESWTSEPPVLEVGARSDRPGSNQGLAEYQAGLALPLWLPGERDRSGAVAAAEGAVVESRVLAAQLRLAAEVRDAHWAYQRASLESEVVARRAESARQLAADVAKRVAAGDLARADSHQAEGSVAAADVAVAESRGAVVAAAQRLRALSGTAPAVNAQTEPEPAPGGLSHPGLLELEDRLKLARRAGDLAAVQTRGNPQIVIGTVRERASFGASHDASFTLGIRVPFGSEARSAAKVASAKAEALETESQLQLQRDRVLADLEAARARLDAARAQLAAAQRRAQLALESRGFFDRSFRLGESDLPTRLRIELEAFEAERQAARQQIELAAAVSALRQAMGLLPE